MPTSPPTPAPARPATSQQQRRVLIVDDHPILREGLVRILTAEPDLQVVGEADDAGTAAQMAEELRPDVAVVDIGLRGRNGIELIKDLQVRAPAVPVLVLSMFDESLYGERAMRAGARGYLMKLEAREKIVSAVRAVLSGGTWFGTAVPQAATTVSPRPADRAAAGPEESPLHRLSDRELEVLQLIGQGQGTRQIAQRLHLSIKTIESHREHLKAKLNLQSGTELVRYAVEHVVRAEGARPEGAGE